jgi:hypothetical protein
MRHRKQVWGLPRHDPLRLTKERVRELRQLCHPDKHSGSPLSQKVTLWLNEIGKVLDSQVV